jgi:hypothetical protein
MKKVKKEIMSLRELLIIAKGKPKSCCDTNPALEATKQKEASGQCCETKKESKCC